MDGQWGKRLRPASAWQVKIADVVHDVTISTDQIVVDAQPLDISMEYTPRDRLIEAAVGGETLSAQIAPIRAGFRLTVRGASHQVRVLPAHLARHAAHMFDQDRRSTHLNSSHTGASR